MFTINIPKVRGKMAELGYSITSFAKELDVSRNTLSSYFEDPRKIPYEILAKMAYILCNNGKEAESIFFDTDLRNT